MKRDAWNRASHLMALLANCHRDPKTNRRAFMPEDFNPFSDGTRGVRRGFALTGSMARRIGDLLAERKVAKARS